MSAIRFRKQSCRWAFNTARVLMHLRREHYVGLGDAVGLFAAFEGTTSLLNGRCNGNLNHEKSPGTDEGVASCS